MIENMRQFSADLQTLLSSYAGVQVYERKAISGSIEPPFVIYSADVRAPENEGREWAVDMFVDVWALGSFDKCFEVAARLDEILDGTVHVMASGSLCCDRNGLVFNRMERDPDDERIRRMSGQYLIRFTPDLFAKE